MILGAPKEDRGGLTRHFVLDILEDSREFYSFRYQVSSSLLQLYSSFLPLSTFSRGPAPTRRVSFSSDHSSANTAQTSLFKLPPQPIDVGLNTYRNLVLASFSLSKPRNASRHTTPISTFSVLNYEYIHFDLPEEDQEPDIHHYTFYNTPISLSLLVLRKDSQIYRVEQYTQVVLHKSFTTATLLHGANHLSVLSDLRTHLYNFRPDVNVARDSLDYPIGYSLTTQLLHEPFPVHDTVMTLPCSQKEANYVRALSLAIISNRGIIDAVEIEGLLVDEEGLLSNQVGG